MRFTLLDHVRTRVNFYLHLHFYGAFAFSLASSFSLLQWNPSFFFVILLLTNECAGRQADRQARMFFSLRRGEDDEVTSDKVKGRGRGRGIQ